MAISTELVNIQKLNAAQREQLLEQLYTVQQEVFAGVSKEQFTNYVVDSIAKETKLLIYKNSANATVGYCAVHLFIVDNGSKKPYAVFRAEAGVRKEYRRRCLTPLFVIYNFLVYKFNHPRHTVYFFGSLVHPASYLQLTRMLPEVYPSVERGMPIKMKEVIDELVMHYGINRADNANAMVGKVGWVTLEAEQESEFWLQHHNQNVRYFTMQNPNYRQGDGLLVLAPITFENLARFLSRIPLSAMLPFLTARKRAAFVVAAVCISSMAIVSSL